jgi:hypothetical protein
MQDVNWFDRLKGNQIEALLVPSAESLRENYLRILTLLHDLLGRYSSAGNPTVILEARDLDHLLSKALLNIRSYVDETRDYHPQIASAREIASPRAPLRADKGSALVIIEGVTYRRSPSTRRLITRFRKRLDLSVFRSESTIRKAATDDLGGLARAISETAWSNIKSAQVLKYLSEGAKDLSRTTSKAVDNFIDSLLDEYNALRSSSLASTQLKEKRQEAPPQVARQARLRK